MATSVNLSIRHTSGATVLATAQSYRLGVSAGGKGVYRLAQCDDYSYLGRSHFPHSPPLSFTVCARVSAENLPGTWGFGLWNDPFGLSLGFGATWFRLPSLPNAVWFFYASPENYLALQEKTGSGEGEGVSSIIPANGFFAGVFRSPRWPFLLLAPALVGVPFCYIRPFARLARRLAARVVSQDGATVSVNATEWHTYSFYWMETLCEFSVDGACVFRTSLSPLPPLGLVIWIDNQYMAFTPQGRLRYGTLANPAMWLEVAMVRVGYP